jgi:hypothetical protein
MQIITPPEATTVAVTQEGDYATLSHADATLTICTLARPENAMEVIYLCDGALQYLPGATPTIAAVLQTQRSEVVLTLYPLTTITAPTAAPFASI